jgi:protein-disulfide isomerase
MKLLAVLALAACAFAQSNDSPVIGSTKFARINLKAPDGSQAVINTEGKITTVIFISTQCPISNDYNQRMKALYADYSQKGVQFVFVNSNSTEPAEEVLSHARQHGFQFPVYKDPDNKEADRFDAQVTPHVFVFDKTGTLAYRGAIDDQRSEERVTKKPLRAALDALLAGQPVPVAEHKAFGCTIKRVKKST